MPDDEWPQDPNQRKVIVSDFDLESAYGDRRQEIVFIGANMDEAAISRQLDSALLTDAELVKYHERYAGVGHSSPRKDQLFGITGTYDRVEAEPPC